MRKPLFVGQSPAQDGDPWRPMTGRFMNFVLALTGWDQYSYRTRFDFVNLVDRFPGKSGKGDAFPMDEARWKANLLAWHGDLDGRLIVCWGRSVARALQVNYAVEFCYLNYSPGGRPYHLMPHPSGINQWWNDSSNRRLAADTLNWIMEIDGCSETK